MKKLKITFILLIVVLMLLVSACSAKDPSTTKEKDETKSTTSDAKEEETKEEETKEPTTLEIFGPGRGFWDPEKNSALKVIMDKTNTILEVTIPEDRKQALTMRMASGDVPDIFTTGRFEYLDYIPTGYILDIKDLLDEYGQDILSECNPDAWPYVTISGKIYGVPLWNNSFKHLLVMRADWAKNLGIELSNPVSYGEYGESMTQDEFSALLLAFTYDDPDGNGEDDTYGYAAAEDYNLRTSFTSLFGMFGGQVEQYYDYDDGVLPYIVTDDYRAGLNYISEQWALKTIDPEIFLSKGEQVQQKIMNSKIGIYTGWWSTTGTLANDGIYDLAPEAEFTHIYTIGNDGRNGILNNGLLSGVTSISTQSENPEVAMQFLNFLSSDEGYNLAGYGIEGEHYTVLDTGHFVKTALGAEVYEQWLLDPLWNLTCRKDVENFQRAAPLGDDATPLQLTQLVFHVNSTMNTAPTYASIFYGHAVPAIETELGTDVKTHVDQMAIEFITGTADVNDDEVWAEYIAEWEKRGGKRILDAYVQGSNDVYGTNYTSGN